MAFNFSKNRNDRFDDMASLPVRETQPINRQPELAISATPEWLTAAQMLLVDAQNEIRNLFLVHNGNVITLRDLQTKDKSDVSRIITSSKIETSDFVTIELPFVDSDIDIEDIEDIEDELITQANGAAEEETYPLNAKVGSSLEFYLKQLREIKPTELEDEQKLVLAAQSGNLDAINHLVSQNLRIVPPIARAHAGRGLALEDLIEEGNLGLYRAIERFDLGMGHRFATYARWWVRHEIRLAVLNQGRLIRLPVHIFKALSRVRRQLELSGQPMPYSTRSPDQIFTDQSPSESVRLSIAEAQWLVLDTPFENDFENSLGDTLPGELDACPENNMQQEQRAQYLTSAIQQLSLNEREVVIRRYGFLDGKPESLDAIGKRLKVSAERVRQIQKNALLHIQKDFFQRGLSLDQLL
jgi:RNA polymerase nonessential primary-like sigma factor